MNIKILDYNKDKEILRKIYKYEESIFGDAGVGKYNIGPFTKYGRTYAIYDEKDIICVIEVLFSLNNIAYIYGVSTHKKYRNKSYASKLMEYVLENLKDEKIKSIELTVSDENIIGIKLYKKFGFEKIKFLEDEYFDGTNRLLMRKDI